MVSEISTEGTTFRARARRQTILRGVNFGRDSKVRYAPDGHTHRPADF